MKYVDEFRRKKPVERLSEAIRSLECSGPLNIMEVCGTHTHNFFRFGLDKMLPEEVRLISGPGCPVCVSTQEYLDKAIAYARHPEILVATFGDMLRVPGTRSSLEQERANGASVRVVYSPLDSLRLAEEHPRKKVVFLATGFETTAPAVALAVLSAKKRGLKNIFFFSSLKLIPPAMRYLLQDAGSRIDGFLCPGHVSCIIGTKPYEFIPKRYKIGCCVTGFEPVDILTGIYLLMRQVISKKPRVANQYLRAVTKNGNIQGQQIIRQVFDTGDAAWRGLGLIASSGLVFKKGFGHFDMEKELPLGIKAGDDLKNCRCAEVLQGLIQPPACRAFGKACTPVHPLGGCMVSEEGTCHAYFKYRRDAL